MARYVGIPSVPLTADPELVRVLLAVKENVELLTDQRGEPDKASVALTSGSFSVPTAETKFQGLSARGNSVLIDNNIAVPLTSDYVKALQDIQQIAADLATVRNVLNLLIIQLRSQQ